jgi:hypothetical protein
MYHVVNIMGFIGLYVFDWMLTKPQNDFMHA